MKDYYSILRLSNETSDLEIRRSFKQLALQYHPDKNPNNPEAEEMFKLINEAYQVLSDPVKKSKYDFFNNYSRQTKSYTQNWSQNPPYAYPFGTQKNSYNRYGKFNWKNVPKYKKWKYYKIDEDYFKTLRITLGIFIGMILLAVGINVGRDYLKEIKEEFRRKENLLTLDSARQEFSQKNYDIALGMMGRLLNNSRDYKFYEKRDSLLNELHKIAYDTYRNNKFNDASTLYTVIRKHELPVTMNTLKYLSESFLKSGNTSEGIGMLEDILLRDPENFELLMQIAKLYYEDLNKPEQAIEYLVQAKQVFRKIQVSVYGLAYEMVMVPETTPEIYFRLFTMRAKVHMTLNDYEKAYKDCNWAIFLRPNSGDMYKLRADCGIKWNYLYKVCNDLSNARRLDIQVDDDLLNKYCN